MIWLTVAALIIVCGVAAAAMYENSMTAPVAPAHTGIVGTVLLGPTCPVERVPPDPQCADRPYATKFSLTNASGSGVIEEFSSDASGAFRVDIRPGEYEIHQATGASMLPRCSAATPILVTAGTYTNVAVSCDTGIR